MRGSRWEKAEQFLSVNDPILAQVIAQYGSCPLEPRKDYYQILCESIISQQISTKVAEKIIGRFSSLFKGGKATPEEVYKLDAEEFREVGLSKQKMVYLRDLTCKVLQGEIDLERIEQCSNEQIEKQLLKVKGIGPWTVTMFLIFALNRPDILPFKDLGVKKAIQSLYGLKDSPTYEEMVEIALSWHPYETIATWYLWRSLENKA